MNQKQLNYIMTQKQFEEAVKANKRIEQLNKVLGEFEMNKNCRLSLVYDGYDVDGHWQLHNVNKLVINFIEDKLKVHTEMLIQEIKKEIEEIKEEIAKI